MNKIKQQNVSKVNIQPPESRQWEVFGKKKQWTSDDRESLNDTLQKDAHISYGIASATANVLLSRREDLSLENIKTTPMWRRSIIQRLVFCEYF